MELSTASTAAPCFWQARHQGLPVSLEISHAPCSPQIEQVSLVKGGSSHNGARGVPHADRPAPSAAGTDLVVDRSLVVAMTAEHVVVVIASCGRSQFAATCAGDPAATGLTTRQTRNPSQLPERRTKRPQWGHAGRTMAVAPAATAGR